MSYADHWWTGLEQTGELPPSDTPSVVERVTSWARGIITRPVDPGPEDTRPRIPFVTVVEALQEWIDEEQRGDAGAMRLPWPTLDTMLGKPIRPTHVILFAARTSVGKTWQLQSVVEHNLARDPDCAGVFVQLEMSALEMAERIAARALRLSPHKARELAARTDLVLTPGFVTERRPELERLLLVEQMVSVQRLGLVVEQAAERLGRVPTFVAVDYLTLIGWEGHGGASRYDRISEAARELKRVAKEFRTIMVGAAQLSRAAGSGDKRPSISDLRESGVIEESVDRLFLSWRPEADPVLGAGVELYLELAKNKFGPVSPPVKLRYDLSLDLVEVPPEPDRDDPYEVFG